MRSSTFFRPELFEFLRQLRRHNNREWFAKHKVRYQQVIVEPALLFIGSFAPHLAGISPFFVADPRPTRGSLFRIYRDTRFSPDKRPFKTHVGIRFSHGSGRTLMRQSSICIWSRRTASRRPASGIRTTAP